MHRYVALFALFCLIAGPLTAYVGLSPPIVGFGIFALSAIVGMVAAGWAVVARLRTRDRGWLVSLGLGLVPMVALVVLAFITRGHPPINDITTDLDDPPPLATAADYPDSFKQHMALAYPDLTPQRVDLAPARAFAMIRELVESRSGWSAVKPIDTPDGQLLEAEVTTAVFRFKDDLVIRVRPADGGGSVVDMRSRSRVGRGDLGANATRIRAFLRDFTARADQASAE